MHRSYHWFVRLASATLTFALLAITLSSIPPQRAEAAAAGQPSTLFRAEFDAAPTGPLTGPLNVETGQVVPQGGSVAVANTSFGRALALQGTSGQATALMQWLNYPGGLPIGEAVTENGLLVQYFERARMELHPELAGTLYEVQLGHLGVAALEAARPR